jgi:hypothetical protein
MAWEILSVPALVCFLAGVFVATSWLEQELLGPHQAVPLAVAEPAAPEHPGGISGVEGGHQWVEDTSRLVA